MSLREIVMTFAVGAASLLLAGAVFGVIIGTTAITAVVLKAVGVDPNIVGAIAVALVVVFVMGRVIRSERHDDRP